jgi:hypothetical protein
MITIKPIVGYRRGEAILTPMDSVLWDDPRRPKPIEIGIVERVKGAPLIVHQGASVPESVLAEAKRKLDERDLDEIKSEGMRAVAEAGGGRSIEQAAAIEDSDTDDDE